MFVFSFRPTLWFACALLAVAGLTSRAHASEREDATGSAALAFPEAPSALATYATLPANLTAPSAIGPLLREMLILSPTFRRQCARIAQAKNLRVEITLRRPRSFEVRAASTILHDTSGTWIATVEVFVDNSLTELVAHELEHVIEQIDGVDLRRLAQQGLAGVCRSGEELYETARAIAAGKRVASEVAAGRGRARANERSAS
jgi:hypothetical protein